MWSLEIFHLDLFLPVLQNILSRLQIVASYLYLLLIHWLNFQVELATFSSFINERVTVTWLRIVKLPDLTILFFY